MALTDVEVCSSALAMIGANAISSLTDGTTEADICSAIYESTVQNEMSMHRWRFVMGEEQLSRLTAKPDGKWDAAYQLPADCLIVSTVMVGDRPIQFDRFGDHIHCNASSTDVVILQGAFRVDEEKWPPYFRTLIELRMASQLAQSLAERTDLSNLLDQRASRQAAIARNQDSQGRTAVRFNTQRITARRFRHGHDYSGFDY